MSTNFRERLSGVSRVARLSLAGVAVAAAVGCGSDGKKTEEPEPSATATAQRTSGVVVNVDAEIGALDESKVAKTFEGAGGAIGQCVDDAQDRVPYLFGDAVIYLRVQKDGQAKYVYFEESTLGDRATEACILKAVESRRWPSPVGGREGYARLPFNLKGRGGVRAPVDWSPADAGKAVSEARTALTKCAADAGAGPLKAALHVAPDGAVISVGVAGSDQASEKAASCVVDAVSKLKFSSPGSYAAKLVIQ